MKQTRMRMANPVGANVAAPRAVNTFPRTLPISMMSTSQLIDDVRVERAIDGSARARSMFISAKGQWNVILPGLTTAQLDMFNAFYAANRAAVFMFYPNCEDVYYSALFSATPMYKVNGGFVDVTLTIVEF